MPLLRSDHANVLAGLTKNHGPRENTLVATTLMTTLLPERSANRMLRRLVSPV